MNDLLRRIYTKIGNVAKRKRLYHKMQAVYEKNGKIQVLRGPFKGMVYPDFVSAGSALYPKLSGIYEKEIQDIIEEIKRKKYKYIYDIGCAEGYYAVGLKRAISDAEVYAFDIDLHAQKMCADMARVNDVEIHVKGECSAQRLKKTAWGGGKPDYL